jgi:hypothetical protein
MIPVLFVIAAISIFTYQHWVENHKRTKPMWNPYARPSVLADQEDRLAQ